MNSKDSRSSSGRNTAYRSSPCSRLSEGKSGAISWASAVASCGEAPDSELAALAFHSSR